MKGFEGGIHKGGVLKLGIWENFMIEWNSQYSGIFSIFYTKFENFYANFINYTKIS